MHDSRPRSRSIARASPRRAAVRLLAALAIAVGGPAPAVAGTAATSQVDAPARSAPDPGRGASPARGAVRLPSELPLRRDADPSVGSGARGVLVLAILAVAVGVGWLRFRGRGGRSGGSARATRWLQQRLGSGGGARAVRVIQSAHLTQRASVHVLQWEDTEWLIGCGDGGVTVIAQRPRSPDAPAQPVAPGGGERT